jgi:hypothetical protein
MNRRSLSFAALALCLAAPAFAQNQAVNPHFLTDLTGWTLLPNPAFAATHDTSQSFNTPGSLRVATPAATATSHVVLRQCRTVAPGQLLDFGGKYRFESGHAANLKGHGSVTWFSDGACTVAAPFPLVGTNTVTDLADTWLPIHANDVTVPTGVNSAFFSLGIGTVAGEGVGWFDDVYFGPDPLTPVELLGFQVE